MSKAVTTRYEATCMLADGLRALNYRESLPVFTSLQDWGKHFFPHYCKLPFGKHHNELGVDLWKLRTERGQKLAYQAPRSYAKSTFISFFFPILAACEKFDNYILILADTSTQAIKYLKAIRHELEMNVELARAYPEACGEGPEWNDASLLLRNGVRIEALSTGQKIRGRKQLSDRPGLIIGDDLQGDEAQFSQTVRDHDWEWFEKGVMHAGNAETNFVMAGTNIHLECIINRILTDRDASIGWVGKVYRACEYPTRMDLWAAWKNILCNIANVARNTDARAFYDVHKADMDAGSSTLWDAYENIYTLMTQWARSPSSFESEKRNNPIDPSKCEWPADLFEGVGFDTWPRNLKYRAIGVDPSHGAALALDTPIWTTKGWKVLNDLQVGDYVYAADGWPTAVTHISPVWHGRETFKVKTATGGVLVADAEHQWRVRLRRPLYGKSVYSIQTTKALYQRQLRMKEFRPPQIEKPEPLCNPDIALPCPPYTLGAWLGDGNSRAGRISQTPTDAKHLLMRIAAEGFWHRFIGVYDWQIYGLRSYLRRANVLLNKHIPPVYFHASAQQRLALLQGLIDTDGSVYKCGEVEFCNTNKRLIDDVCLLLSTFGIKHNVQARWTRNPNRFKNTGKPIQDSFGYRVTFYFDEAASMPRKRIRAHNTKKMGHYLTIEPNGLQDTRCITVEHPSGMFLAGKEMLPTHNSNQSGDFCAITLLGVGDDGLLYIDADLEPRFIEGPNGVVDRILQLSDFFKPDVIGIESDQCQQLIGVRVQDECAKRGWMPLPVVPIPTEGVPKPVRIRRLGPYIGMRSIRFKNNSAGTIELIRQLKMFNGAKDGVDDGPDSAEMAIRALQKYVDYRDTERIRQETEHGTVLAPLGEIPI